METLAECSRRFGVSSYKLYLMYKGAAGLYERMAADVAVPLPMLLLIWPAVLLVAASLALIPARRSAGVQPSGVLRSE